MERDRVLQLDTSYTNFRLCERMLSLASESLRTSKDFYQTLRVGTIQTPEDLETTERLILQLIDLVSDVERVADQMSTLAREAGIAKNLAKKLVEKPATEPESARTS